MAVSIMFMISSDNPIQAEKKSGNSDY